MVERPARRVAPVGARRSQPIARVLAASSCLPPFEIVTATTCSGARQARHPPKGWPRRRRRRQPRRSTGGSNGSPRGRRRRGILVGGGCDAPFLIQFGV